MELVSIVVPVYNIEKIYRKLCGKSSKTDL